MCMYMSVYMCLCLCVFIWVCVCLCVCIWMYVYTCVCLCMYMCVCMCTYVCWRTLAENENSSLWSPYHSTSFSGPCGEKTFVNYKYPNSAFSSLGFQEKPGEWLGLWNLLSFIFLSGKGTFVFFCLLIIFCWRETGAGKPQAPQLVAILSSFWPQVREDRNSYSLAIFGGLDVRCTYPTSGLPSDSDCSG